MDNFRSMLGQRRIYKMRNEHGELCGVRKDAIREETRVLKWFGQGWMIVGWLSECIKTSVLGIIQLGDRRKSILSQ